MYTAEIKDYVARRAPRNLERHVDGGQERRRTLNRVCGNLLGEVTAYK